MGTEKSETKEATSAASSSASSTSGSKSSTLEAARASASAAGKSGATGTTAAAASVAVVPAAPAVRERDVGRDKAIELTVSTIEKQFGKGSIMRLGDGMAPPEVMVVPTGSLGLDIALGVGGLPRGRIVEVYGPESSGKTTLALARRGAGAAGRRDLRLRRRRARAGRRLRAQARACAPTICWSRSPTAASRRWRSPRCSSARGRST